MPDGSNDLATLFRQANRGDGDAYRRLLTQMTPWLRGFVRKSLSRFGQSTDDCEDIVQETLIAVHIKRHTWDESKPVEPWVRAIATYKMIDASRRRGTYSHVPIDDLADVLPASPDADVGNAIDRGRLLEKLPDRQRRIVEHIAIEGRSAGEVASSLGMTEGAVRVALHRALKSMGDAFRRGSA